MYKFLLKLIFILLTALPALCADITRNNAKEITVIEIINYIYFNFCEKEDVVKYLSTNKQRYEYAIDVYYPKTYSKTDRQWLDLKFTEISQLRLFNMVLVFSADEFHQMSKSAYHKNTYKIANKKLVKMADYLVKRIKGARKEYKKEHRTGFLKVLTRLDIFEDSNNPLLYLVSVFKTCGALGMPEKVKENAVPSFWMSYCLIRDCERYIARVNSLVQKSSVPTAEIDFHQYVFDQFFNLFDYDYTGKEEYKIYYYIYDSDWPSLSNPGFKEQILTNPLCFYRAHDK